jgi:lipopolysaccharide transport system ATP-binding protein
MRSDAVNESAVQVENLSKIYRVYDTPWDRFREVFAGGKRHREFRALSEINFEIPQGEGLAIIGENGAGKSTLLKILAGITAPTQGTAHVRGKIASILELGSGFHPEFTGRQNIVLNAAMLGLSEQMVEQKTPEIIAFSELGEFIDQPVKCYSTGMTMRLGFAIATQVEPEVLIIDEALSVGDGYFQKKCMDQLERFVRSGQTLLFCSHAMYYASAFCDRAVWLRQGRIEAFGPVLQVVQEYESYLVARSGEGRQSRIESAVETEDSPARPARLTKMQLGKQGDSPISFLHGEPWSLEIEWQAQESEHAFHIAVGLDRTDGVQVCSFGTLKSGRPAFQGKLEYRVKLDLPELPILQGEYSIYVFLLDERGLHVYDQGFLEKAFRISSDSYQIGLFLADHSWED